MDEQKFITGFNSGYLLSKHRPDMLKMLSASLEPGNDFLDGIQSGAKQYEKEKSKTQSINDKQPNKQKDDLEMEKD